MKKLLMLLVTVSMLGVFGCKEEEETVVAPVEGDVVVSAVVPIQGNAGTIVTITGSNFGTDKSLLKVEFGTAVAVIDSIIGGTQIKTKVPTSAISGTVSLKVTKSNKSGVVDFIILDMIVGTWVSEGLNVPIGLRSAPFKVKKITATFNENKSYTVVQIDSAGITTTFTGTITYSASTSKDTVTGSTTKDATIYNIVANQATPSVVTSTGIYAISGTNMTYEIIQTSPALGVTPPSPAAGFGSTSVGSTKYPIYIQKYVKQ